MPPYTIVVQILDSDVVSVQFVINSSVAHAQQEISKSVKTIADDATAGIQVVINTSSATRKTYSVERWTVKDRYFSSLGSALMHARGHRLENPWYELWVHTLNGLALCLNTYDVMVCPQRVIEILKGTVDSESYHLQSRRRIPDFGVEIRRRASDGRVDTEALLLLELKRASFSRTDSVTHKQAAARQTVKDMWDQVKDQAPVAFAYYPEVQDLHFFCCVGSSFSLQHFNRNHMSPGAKEKPATRSNKATQRSPRKKPKETQTTASGIHDLFAFSNHDEFSVEFKQIIQYIIQHRVKSLTLQGDWFTPEPAAPEIWQQWRYR
ncbi:hypothetical protein PUNSTDRAFT_44706 [Punctularia strigosozonata HHB-11173 SS5]|uniref:uncharacterized protein n=1 Tax=Punctularia strigosozonata (strain HHB-11173) TaxID=741275 RepID=UPI00044177D0|nr:uncharacterized protein PUNSTDRAFT_44706 [Punctularia strigosozonata HHB-11173 SS5]EIN09343.1 hypothetical protein PUNSTDRAFT_44706 [Punctularia strigosozonata HHB-11173 SS5]